MVKAGSAASTSEAPGAGVVAGQVAAVVLLALHDYLVAGARVHCEGELVGHHAAGDRGPPPKNARYALLEAIDRGVFAVHVVAHLGGRHRLAHVLRRARDRVAAQIAELRLRV
jgi:hypothetical protein